jgi:hypothetical protein
MNDIQSQHNPSPQAVGVISNFRRIPTKSGRQMAAFTIGRTQSKCFGLVVGQAEELASKGKTVSVTGHFSNHSGERELVADNIGLAVEESNPSIDNRPEKPAMEVSENYIVITIPVGVTHEQVRRITNIANETLRGVGPGIFESASAKIETIHPKNQVQGSDIPF